MGVYTPLEKAPATETGRHPCGFYTIPAGVTDLSFTRGF
jgi:hypothetical protein